MVPPVARIATKGNHQILSNWLKRATSPLGPLRPFSAKAPSIGIAVATLQLIAIPSKGVQGVRRALRGNSSSREPRALIGAARCFGPAPSCSRFRSTSYVGDRPCGACAAMGQAAAPPRTRNELPSSFVDYLVGAEQDRWGYGKAQRLGGLEVHDHLKF